MIDVLKVSSKSNPNSVAGALAGVIRSRGSAEVQVVGAGALNQAIKAMAIARGFLATSGQDLVCRPTFADIRIDGEDRTAIRLLVEAAALRPVVTADPAGIEVQNGHHGHDPGPDTGLDGHGAPQAAPIAPVSTPDTPTAIQG